jgi:pyruvate ferredoxin oxidoreductase gamma subunit
MDSILEVRWHGTGGMGAVTASELFANAAIDEGKYAQSFPSFGTERRGAPVFAFLRISDEFIRTRGNIETPDIVVVMAAKIMSQIDVTSGLKENGKVIINSRRSPRELKSEFDLKWSVASVDATTIALETIKLPIFNTAMMGAVAKVMPVVKIESLEKQLKERFGKRADANIAAMTRAYHETTIEE